MTKILAHRGFSGVYPENTLLSFQKALLTGCDGLELDIHLTKDRQLVIIHDETLDRTTDGTGWVGAHTLKELKALNAAARTDYPRQSILTLGEYFEFLGDRCILTNIELKTGVVWYEGIEAEMIRTLRQYNRLDQVLVSSFNHYSIQKVVELVPGMPVAFVEESRVIAPWEYLERHGISCFHPFYSNVGQPGILKGLRAAGISINVWTVNEEEDMRAMLRLGVDGIMTNYPDKLAAIRQEYEKGGQ